MKGQTSSPDWILPFPRPGFSRLCLSKGLQNKRWDLHEDSVLYPKLRFMCFAIVVCAWRVCVSLIVFCVRLCSLYRFFPPILENISDGGNYMLTLYFFKKMKPTLLLGVCDGVDREAIGS